MVKRGKESKINWLKWAINFCNTDLQAIDQEEKFYLTHILEGLFYPFHSPEDIRKNLFEVRRTNQFPLQIPDEIWGKISSIQERFRDFFNDIINRRKEVTTLRKEEKNDSPIHIKRMWWLASSFFPIFVLFTDGSTRSGYIPLEFDYDYLQGRFFKTNDENDPTLTESEDLSLEILKEGKISSISRTLYLAWLFGILDGIPIRWIQKCKGCDRLFINPTERTKMYCNSSCASRSIAKEKREELKKDPKKYKAFLKKQKKYMKKRYNEMRKAQLGPNVRVGKKMRKRKEG